ncbi:MAG: PRC-barrel domain-containing protein [Rhodospirillaceae bacterium]|nr:PRC-barrel domain-containing protein [Rhodospirillales bacterium]
MKAFMTATALVLTLAGAPSFAQQAGQQQAAQPPASKQPGQAAGAQGQSMSGRIPVTAASQIVGRNVQDASGKSAGEVEYLMLSLADGAVRYVVLGSGGILNFGQDYFVALPWDRVAEVPANGSVRLSVSTDQLNSAPRFTREALTDLTKPAVLTSVIDHYRTPGGAQAQGQPPAAGQSAAPPTPQQQAQSQGATPGQGQKQAGQGGSEPQLMIGRTITTTMMAPVLARSGQITGAEVRTQDGKVVGEVDQVMIDTSHGQVAYALLARGGFLGIGEDWVPVPLEALSWTPEQQTLTIAANEKQVNQIPVLKRSNLPQSVNAAQVRSLYQRFGLTPYWQQMASSEPPSAKGVQ